MSNLSVRGQNYCGIGNSSMVIINVDPCNGISDLNSGIALKLAPNPTDRILQIDIDGVNEDLELNIWNNIGQPIFTDLLSGESLKYSRILDLENQQKGVYILSIKGKKSILTEMIILQ
jgi:hypothetical protein